MMSNAIKAEPRGQRQHGTASVADYVESARAMIPTLKQRASQCEAEGRVPDATVADFKQAGFHRMVQPVAFGGSGLQLGSCFEVGLELGRGCGSSAWMGVQWALHSFSVGMFPLQAQEEIWARSSDVCISTASARIRSEISRVSGGYRLSGQWAFSSGVDHAEWVQIFNTGDQSGAFGNCLIPRQDITIIDDWDVAGLEGTGSKSFTVDNVFVPDHRVLTEEAVLAGKTPGRDLHPEIHFYTLPTYAFLPWTLASVAIGMAQGMVDLFEEQLPQRKSRETGTSLATWPTSQVRLAESAAAVEAARLLLRTSVGRFGEFAASGRDVPPEVFQENGRNLAFAIHLTRRAVDDAFDMLGANAVYASNPAQRQWRDFKAATHHSALSYDPPMQNYGRARWGLEVNSLGARHKSYASSAAATKS